MNAKRARWPIIFCSYLVLLCLVSAVSACQPAARPAAQPSPLPPAPTAAPEQAVARAAWQRSPHANTYDEGKGPNTYCARCHSPLNWDPAAVIDAAPNCVSCKFAFDPQMRIAKGNPPVAKEAWRSVGCEVCHRMADGIAGETASWLDARTGYHEAVASSTELCAKCHTDTATIRHARDLGTQAHRGFTCTDCHDAHSTVASCTAANCHAAIPGPTPGHDSAHGQVNCVACHDAAKLDVGPDAAKGIWLTYRTTELLGRKTRAAYQSHNVQKAVDCTRCHYTGNPWKLSVQNGAAR